jgi:hypothetical protein
MDNFELQEGGTLPQAAPRGRGGPPPGGRGVARPNMNRGISQPVLPSQHTQRPNVPHASSSKDVTAADREPLGKPTEAGKMPEVLDEVNLVSFFFLIHTEITSKGIRFWTERRSYHVHVPREWKIESWHIFYYNSASDLSKSRPQHRYQRFLVNVSYDMYPFGLDARSCSPL